MLHAIILRAFVSRSAYHFLIDLIGLIIERSRLSILTRSFRRKYHHGLSHCGEYLWPNRQWSYIFWLQPPDDHVLHACWGNDSYQLRESSVVILVTLHLRLRSILCCLVVLDEWYSSNFQRTCHIWSVQCRPQQDPSMATLHDHHGGTHPTPRSRFLVPDSWFPSEGSIFNAWREDNCHRAPSESEYGNWKQNLEKRSIHRSPHGLEVLGGKLIACLLKRNSSWWICSSLYSPLWRKSLTHSALWHSRSSVSCHHEWVGLPKDKH